MLGVPGHSDIRGAYVTTSDAVDPVAAIRHEPVRTAMSKMAAGLRGSAAVAALVAALIGLPDAASPRLLACTLIALIAWTGVYARLAWTRGLTAWMIAVDLVMASYICLLVGQLVPRQVLQGGASWVSGLASITVICAQLRGRPVLSIPAGLLVAGSFVVGSRIADVSAGGVAQAFVIAVQSILAAATMIVAVRTGRRAAEVFTDYQKAEHAAAIRSAERADALAHLRKLHNGPLTTLTMALHADPATTSDLLRRCALADLRDLARSATARVGDQRAPIRLDEQLAQVAVWYEPQLKVSTVLPAVSVPDEVAEAFTDATKEALENVFRHAAVEHARLELDEYDGRVRVTVADRGRGFSPGGPPYENGFGLREAIVGTMTAVGGSAEIRSAPEAGTTVLLEWRHG
jgi:hypothetical protein